jgi:hypothetical protein
MFASYELSKQFLGVKNENEFTLKQSLVASVISSIITTPVVNAAEMIKCRMQVQNGTQLYSNSFDCLRHLLVTEGPQGLMTGLFATAMRDVPGIIIHFVVYYVAKRFWCTYI